MEVIVRGSPMIVLWSQIMDVLEYTMSCLSLFHRHGAVYRYGDLANEIPAYFEHSFQHTANDINGINQIGGPLMILCLPLSYLA